MSLKKAGLIVALGFSMASTQVLAQSAPAPATTSSSQAGSSDLHGGFIIPLLALIAIILGILAATHNHHNHPTSP